MLVATEEGLSPKLSLRVYVEMRIVWAGKDLKFPTAKYSRVKCKIRCTILSGEPALLSANKCVKASLYLRGQ